MFTSSNDCLRKTCLISSFSVDIFASLVFPKHVNTTKSLWQNILLESHSILIRICLSKHNLKSKSYVTFQTLFVGI